MDHIYNDDKNFTTAIARLIDRMQLNSDHYLTDDPKSFAENLFENAVHSRNGFDDFWTDDAAQILVSSTAKQQTDDLLSLLQPAPHDFKVALVLNLPDLFRDERLQNVNWQKIFYVLTDDKNLLLDGHINWQDITAALPDIAKGDLNELLHAKNQIPQTFQLHGRQFNVTFGKPNLGHSNDAEKTTRDYSIN